MFKLDIYPSKNLGYFDPEDTSIPDAIYSIYPITAGDVILNWNGCDIKLSLNSLSYLYNDIENMIQRLSLGESFIQYFLCSAFTAAWDIKINGDDVTIESKWTSVGGGEAIRRKLKKTSNIIYVNKNDFIGEWSNLLGAIKMDLRSKGYGNLLDIR